jgi:hypothetical protein
MSANESGYVTIQFGGDETLTLDVIHALYTYMQVCSHYYTTETPNNCPQCHKVLMTKALVKATVADVMKGKSKAIEKTDLPLFNIKIQICCFIRHHVQCITGDYICICTCGDTTRKACVLYKWPFENPKLVMKLDVSHASKHGFVLSKVNAVVADKEVEEMQVTPDMDHNLSSSCPTTNATIADKEVEEMQGTPDVDHEQ